MIYLTDVHEMRISEVNCLVIIIATLNIAFITPKDASYDNKDMDIALLHIVRQATLPIGFEYGILF